MAENENDSEINEQEEELDENLDDSSENDSGEENKEPEKNKASGKRYKYILPGIILLVLIGLGVFYFLNTYPNQKEDKEFIGTDTTKLEINSTQSSPVIKSDIPNFNHTTCAECNGNGRIIRKGEIDCPNCLGKGNIVCDKCTKGKTMCKSCKGKGFVSGLQCKNCWGEGNLDCDYCYGIGTLKCKNCKATGKVMGTIKDLCLKCYGTGLLD